MARYAVEHIWEGKQEYFLIRDHQSWQMVLLPSKYLTHLIRANRSPNTVGRRAKSIRFYLEYLDEKEMELSQVAELEFQEQYEHYVGFLHWLKAEEQTMKKKQVLAVSSALMIGTTTALTGLLYHWQRLSAYLQCFVYIHFKGYPFLRFDENAWNNAKTD